MIRLTARQELILAWTAMSVPAKEQAAMLKVSPRTVEWHRAYAQRKLNLPDVAAITRYALCTMLIPLQEQFS